MIGHPKTVVFVGVFGINLIRLLFEGSAYQTIRWEAKPFIECFKLAPGVI